MDFLSISLGPFSSNFLGQFLLNDLPLKLFCATIWLSFSFGDSLIYVDDNLGLGGLAGQHVLVFCLDLYLYLYLYLCLYLCLCLYLYLFESV